MLQHFFQLGPIPVNALQGHYDIRLVLLSYIVATCASYIALDITGRLRDIRSSKKTILMWLIGGAVAMGAGIWSMHFIGMLAFSMPDMSMSYNPYWTALSMLVAVLASCFALLLLKEQTIKKPRLVLGGIILGFAIASMHYVGMQAMQDNMDIHYLPGLFTISIIIAVLASEAAIWLALKSNQGEIKTRLRLKFISAFIMGAAICGMHYTGMSAAIFTPKDMLMQNMSTLNPQILAIAIAGVTIVVLGIAFFVSIYKEAIQFNQLATARQAGMTEVATSVLHNVGNILNSVNVSATIVSEKVTRSRLGGLTDLSSLLDQHAGNISDFIANDPRGKQVPEFIKMLSSCWQDEQSQILKETASLIVNIEHIKNIITTQQDLGKNNGLEQVVFIKDMLDQSLLITGLDNNKYGIDIVKEYASLHPVYVDKIKLMQILVNLLRNAKDSVAMSSSLYKCILIKTGVVNSNSFWVEITDNGLGVMPENLNKIFSYGFTTKESGHGFGLHSCALSANEMGGSLRVKSDGLNKGAIFTLELPYEHRKDKMLGTQEHADMM